MQILFVPIFFITTSIYTMDKTPKKSLWGVITKPTDYHFQIFLKEEEKKLIDKEKKLIRNWKKINRKLKNV